jgi:hypothetical protein
VAKSHSEGWIRLLVDEALNRTPKGGFPEIERREGLRPGTLFDWVDTYGMLPLPMSAVHVWAGVVSIDAGEFSRYFEHDPHYWDLEVEQIEAAGRDVTGCGFCVDLESSFLYDEDLLQVLWRDSPVAVARLLDESTLHSDAVRAATSEAGKHGLVLANAVFVYGDPTQVVPHPGRLHNGLRYLGLFDNAHG